MALHDVIRYNEHDAMHIINFLSILLPIVLYTRFDKKFKMSKLKAITKEEYSIYRENFRNELIRLKCTQLNKLAKCLKYNDILECNPDTLDTLQEFFKLNKDKIKYKTRDPKTEINGLVNFFKIKELKDSHIKRISNLSRYIPDIKIKNLLKSIEGFTHNQVDADYQESNRVLIKFLRKKFNQDTLLTPEQAREVRDNYPEVYKKYNKLKGDRAKLAKQVLENVWEQEGYDLVDVKIAKQILNELGIPNPIDKGYRGKVGLSTSPTGLFTYYTIYGKELNTVPGVDVVMNPNYTKDDLVNYCTCSPQGVSTRKARDSKPIYVYTKDYYKKSLEKKHSKVTDMTPEKMKELRKKYINDYLPILSGSITPQSIKALITAVIDTTCGRIGNAQESLKFGVFGIHTLQCRHILFSKDMSKAKIEYDGKDSVHQVHIVSNPQIIKALKMLKSNKKPNDFIFSVHGKNPLPEDAINKYIKSVGFPFTAHGFRKYHANRIFKKYTQDIGSDPVKTFDFAVDHVAKKLGHLPMNSIKSYIDIDLIKNYFKDNDVQPPKKVLKVLQLMERDK